jgi:FkbM family methyltransferase
MKVDKLISNTQPDSWYDEITNECRGYPIDPLPDLNENSLIVDAGCNVGGFVNAFSYKFNKWVCIDASSYNIDQFRKNHPNFNGLLLNKALYSKSNEIVKLKKYTDENLKDTPSGNFGILDFVYQHNNHGWKDNEYEEISSLSLEDLLLMINDDVDLLKVDIEGSEYDFLCNKDLSKINYIVMELHNFLGEKKKILCDWIKRTHNETYSSGDGVGSHFLKMWKRK